MIRQFRRSAQASLVCKGRGKTTRVPAADGLGTLLPRHFLLCFAGMSPISQ
jgi:hypothetical protein